MARSVVSFLSPWSAGMHLSNVLDEKGRVVFVVVGLTLSLLAQFPLRCFQAENFVAPYARAAEDLHNSNADVVGFNPLDGWYITDLIRNDPYLQHGPMIVSLYFLRESQAAQIQKQFPSRRLVTKTELKSFGLSTDQF